MAIEARLARDAISQISDAQREPDWLRERREAAWDIYESTREPSRSDEEWRRTDLRWLKWDELPLSLPTGTRGDVPTSVPLGALSPSAVVLVDNAGTHIIEVSVEARDAGLIVMDLATAARDHPDLIRDRLSTSAVTPEQGKFQALNTAIWTAGVFVHAPRGASITQPVVLIENRSVPMSQPRVLVTAAEGSTANVIEWWTVPNTGMTSLRSCATELFADTGSTITYTHSHATHSNLRSLHAQHAVVGRDATFTSTNVTTGGQFHKATVGTTLIEPGAEVTMNSAYHLSGKQFVDHHTLQHHQASDGASDLLFAGVLDGTAHSVYAGTIMVDPPAQRTNAYQNNRNLLLKQGTRADSIPRLEIMADDVRCTHGATASTIDPSHLYYLSSRGLTDADARALIVEGYFEAVLGRVPYKDVRDVLRDILSASPMGEDGARR